MTNVPPISVVMPVYNAVPYLEEAIRSILTQSWEDFEFVIIDNGSSDGSSEVIKSFTDSRIRVITNPVNIGPPPALNQALRLARGKYVARMDADDVALPERLEKQWKFLEDHPNCAALGTQVVFINATGRKMYTPWCPTMADAIRWRLLFTSPLAHTSVMMRSGVVLSLGGYMETLRHAADYDLWFRLLAQGYDIANLPDVLAHVRVHGQSDGMSTRDSPVYLQEMVSVSQDHIRALLHVDVPQEQLIVLRALAQQSRSCPDKAKEAIELLRTVSRAFGPRGRPFFGLTILSLALSSPLRLSTRARLIAEGIVALALPGRGSGVYGFIWREWIASGRLLERLRFEWRRLHKTA